MKIDKIKTIKGKKIEIYCCVQFSMTVTRETSQFERSLLNFDAL